MDALRLVQDEEKVAKPLHWKKERVNYWCSAYLNSTGKRDPIGYPALMRLLSLHCEEHWSYPDDETGEILFEIPPIEEWQKEVDGFFKDDFRIRIQKFFFPSFLKNYGSFQKTPVVKQRQVNKRPIMITCEFCQKIRQPNGCCEHCGK
jgi:hypothetical protein